MTIEQIIELRNSPEAPYNHDEYSIWLHNKIIDRIKYELWEFREGKSSDIGSSYVACNHIMNLPSLKTIQ